MPRLMCHPNLLAIKPPEWALKMVVRKWEVCRRHLIHSLFAVTGICFMPGKMYIPKGANEVSFWLGLIFFSGIRIHYPKRKYFGALGCIYIIIYMYMIINAYISA